MKFCPKCGNPTDDHATFCNQCGAPLNDQPNTDGTAHSSSDFQGTGGHRTIIISRITITSQPEEHRSVLPTGLLLAASLFALSFPLLPAEFTAFTGC